jgi:hypothetical protein
MRQDSEILKMLFPKKGYPDDYCKNYIPSKAQVTERAQITEFLSKLLIRTRLTGIGKHYASEVTLDYGNGKGKQIRVDYMQFKPVNQYSVSGIEKGEFICYEIKSCTEDVFSGHGLNAEGERNYIVTTMDTWKRLVDLEHKDNKTIPNEFGVMVACHQNKLNEFDNPTPISYSDGWRLEVIKQASLKYRKRSMNELLFCMLRSGR